MLAHRPDFFFTRSQQKLLELALLDRSDREISIELALDPDTLKKRWRSIYGRIDKCEPDFWGNAVDGPRRRNLIVRRVRNNMAELRPYPRPVARALTSVAHAGSTA
jgi:hypothetical protein